MPRCENAAVTDMPTSRKEDVSNTEEKEIWDSFFQDDVLQWLKPTITIITLGCYGFAPHYKCRELWPAVLRRPCGLERTPA